MGKASGSAHLRRRKICHIFLKRHLTFAKSGGILSKLLTERNEIASRKEMKKSKKLLDKIKTLC